jgi:histone H1/5
MDKAPAAKKLPSHPTTADMVNEAVESLNAKGGSSLQAIKKYISETHKTADLERLAPFIRKYLKKAVETGTLVQTKGKGASGSFKLRVATKTLKGEKKAAKNSKAASPKMAKAASPKNANAKAASPKMAKAASPKNAKASPKEAKKVVKETKVEAAAAKKLAPVSEAAPALVAPSKAPAPKPTAKAPAKKATPKPLKIKIPTALKAKPVAKAKPMFSPKKAAPKKK